MRTPQMRFAGRALALALALGLAVPAAWGLDMALDARLAALLRQGYEKPDKARDQLDRLEREASAAPRSDELQFARARLLVIEGNTRAATALAAQLAQRPGLEGRVELLRAEIAEREGRSIDSEQAALRAQELLMKPCAVITTDREGRAHLPADCDFRVLWAALNIVRQMHGDSGALPQAESIQNTALELAQAGGDRVLVVASMGVLALLDQRQGQPEAARQWLAEALQAAQGDDQTMILVHLAEAGVSARAHDLAGEYRSLEQALQLAARADAPHTVAHLQANLTDYYIANAQSAEAMRLGEEALPVLVRFKDRLLLRVLYHNLGIASLQLRRFDQARQYLARAEENRGGLSDTAMHITELAELGQAWARAGDYKEAIRVFREERQLTAQLQARNREAALQQVRTRFDSERKQRELDLLKADTALKDQQLGNQSLAQKLGMAVAGLTGLSLVLVVVMLVRVRQANRRLRSRQSLLKAQSERDPLTDLANRRLFLALMESHARETFEGALLMVDIDHFKRVNDEFGHASGDAVIAEVAKRLGRTVRSEDIVVRWGGEEYLIYVRGMEPFQLQQLAERMLEAVGGQPLSTEKGPLRVTVSIGFVRFPLVPGELRLHWERAVNWADMALYSAKALGRNRAVGVVSVQADESALAEIEADFETAVTQQRVTLVTLPGPDQA
jgi:diguanylate cyclase (GGDEF)-like protein